MKICRRIAVFLLVSLPGMFIRQTSDVEASRAHENNVLTYVNQHQKAIIKEFIEFLRIPNVASDHRAIEQNAGHLLQMLRQRNIEARLLRIPNANPVVYGSIQAPNAAKTVVFYAHYDGQPVDPGAWKMGPWNPAVFDGPIETGGTAIPTDALPDAIPRDWRIYARSASDDKAAIVGILTAVDALRD